MLNLIEISGKECQSENTACAEHTLRTRRSVCLDSREESDGEV